MANQTYKMIAVSPEVARELRIASLKKGITVKEITETLILEYLKKEGFINE